MARVFRAPSGDEFRLICPECQTMWSTIECPSYCQNDDCGVMVTVRTIKWTARELRRADGEAKALHRMLTETALKSHD